MKIRFKSTGLFVPPSFYAFFEDGLVVNIVMLSQNVIKVPGGAREVQLQSPQVKPISINLYFLYEIWLMDVSTPGVLRHVKIFSLQLWIYFPLYTTVANLMWTNGKIVTIS